MVLTIRELFNTLRAQIETLAGCGGKRSTKHAKAAQILEAAGGKYIGRGRFSRAYEFSFPYGSFVIKYSLKRVDIVSRETLNKSEILRAAYLKPIFTSKHVVIQPKADCETTRALNTWVRRLRRKLMETHGTHLDCKRRNAGKFKGRFFLIDSKSLL